MDDYVVFILSHGRPDKVITYRTLRRQGYTGPIYIVIDNEDKTADRYYELYGDQVVMFDKAAVAARIDEGDNFKDRRAVIYARNACFDIAEQLGYRYFIQLDDDYTHFRYMLDGELRSLYVTRYVVSLDAVFDIVFAFYKSIPAKTIAFAQGGDVIGSGDSSELKRVWLKRKAMNSFFCDTSRRFEFFGRINEDVNTYVLGNTRGGLFFQFYSVVLSQISTQKSDGGMSGIYNDSGTYIKSFYTVMYAPSCCKVYTVGIHDPRIHHRISWENAAPKILREEYRRTG